MTLDCRDIAREAYDLADSEELIAPLVREALQVIDQALDTYGEDRVSISFNGGKDCTVLLHLFAGSLARRQSNLNTKGKPIQSLYIPVPSPFPALESFINQCVEAYNLDLFHCVPDLSWNKGDASGNGNGNGAVTLPVESTTSPEPSLSPGIKDHVDVDAATIHHAVGKSKGGEGMRRGLELYKKKYPNVDAILVGTRRGDPHGAKLSHRNMTDPGWPTFERINPIINWDYKHVWTFLRRLRVRYCMLYDEGYTSLGSTYNTFPNPALLIQPSCSTTLTPAIGDASASTPSSTAHDPSTIPNSISISSSTTLAPMTMHPSTPIPTPIVDGLVPDPDPPVPDGLVPSQGKMQPDAQQQQEARYRPAYELLDGSLEREGRVPHPSLSSANRSQSQAQSGHGS